MTPLFFSVEAIEQALKDTPVVQAVRDGVFVYNHTAAALMLARILTALQSGQVAILSRDQAAEVCICAAIRINSELVVRGHRHDSCYHTASLIPGVTPESIRKAEQGFVTSRNRYVDRREGRRLQIEARIPSVATGGHQYTRWGKDDSFPTEV